MRGLELREFLRVTNRARTRREEGEEEVAPPLFFVSVASKRLIFLLSSLESAPAGKLASVAFEGITRNRFRAESLKLRAETEKRMTAEGLQLTVAGSQDSKLETRKSV